MCSNLNLEGGSLVLGVAMRSSYECVLFVFTRNHHCCLF